MKSNNDNNIYDKVYVIVWYLSLLIALTSILLSIKVQRDINKAIIDDTQKNYIEQKNI